MNRPLFFALVLALSGCSSAPRSEASTTASVLAAAQAEAGTDREALSSSRARVHELEAQLGLAQAEARGLRDEAAALRASERASAAQVAAECAPPPPREIVREPEPEQDDDGPRPLLRLYGTAGPPARSASGVRALPGPDAPYVVAPPPVASIRLPVAVGAGEDPEAGVPAIPSAPVAVLAGAPASPGSSSQAAARNAPPDPAVQEYRAALAHLSARRLEDAVVGLDGFLRDHPGHPYADNALYWRGEIHYTRRDYRRALTTFSSLLERYPRGNKVPDALLRIGLCYERVGERGRARRVFERLRMQYPESVAAQMAPEEQA